MAELFVKHSLNSKKVVKFNLCLREFTVKLGKGESKWYLEIGTLERDLNGDKIKPTYLDTVNEEKLEEEVEKALHNMCSLVFWDPHEVDNDKPYYIDYSPKGVEVPINTSVMFEIKDDMPSAGIDLSNMAVILNNGEVDFDITDKFIVKGDPYNYKFIYIPERYHN